MEKNDLYWDADSVTMPVINMYLSDNNNNTLANFLDGD